jgi:mono/diheme cytochrome c family protein
MRYAWFALLFLVIATVSILGFRGAHTKLPPLEVYPDMDRQPKYKPQAESHFFADGRTDRPLPAGVVSRGATVAEDSRYLAADDHMFRGYSGPLLPNDTKWYRGFPDSVTVNEAFLKRGRERFTVFCTPCHGQLGDGNGITRQYGMGNAANYQDDRIRQMAEGEIFNTITNGKATMMGYGDRIPPEDRWAIIAYVRALQRAQHGTVQDVPAANRSQLGL